MDEKSHRRSYRVWVKDHRGRKQKVYGTFFDRAEAQKVADEVGRDYGHIATSWVAERQFTGAGWVDE
jgi:hypothetical protein